MQIKTIEDVKNNFPTESEAKEFIKEIRWGKWASCAYCGNSRCYIIENGLRFKCADKSCNKKFGALSNTLFHGNKIPLQDVILILFLYAKTRGRVAPFEICSAVKITANTEGLFRKKVDFLWKCVLTDGKDLLGIIKDMLISSFTLYDKFVKGKNEPYKKTPFLVSDIDNISDVRQYNKLLRYTKYYINVYCHWIFLDFASAEDVLSETFIYMSENNIKEYDAEIVIKMIQKVTNKMYEKYLNEHPEFNEHLKTYRKKWKSDGRYTLHNTYIVEIIYSRKSNLLTRKQIRSDIKLIQKTREQIQYLRNRKSDTGLLKMKNGKQINKSVASLISKTLGLSNQNRKGVAKCSKEYWDEVCEIIGDNYKLTQKKIAEAKDKYKFMYDGCTLDSQNATAFLLV